MSKKLLLTSLLVLVLSFTMHAQNESNQWSVGVGIGKMEYDGARGSNAVFKSPFNLQFGARISKYVGPLFDVSLAASIGKQGLYNETDAPNQFRGNTFQTNLGIHLKPIKSDKFQPFISAAIGYFSYSDDSPASVMNPGVDASGLAVPVGVGLKINITDGFGLYYHTQYGIEYSGDAYNGIDPDSKDKYWLHELGFAYNFGMKDRDGDRVPDKKDLCPDVPGLKNLDGCPDSDLDGIADKDDACPELAGVIEHNGCPDTDGDGIIDPNDDCPLVKGEERYRGCPDTDNDGIGDSVDECPDNPGVARYNGCPIPDTDGDGFNDEDDECPTTKGDLRGCPDTDGDGFHDKEDNCVKTPGTAQGCPDKDNDGIADKDDECPEVAGIPEKNGCPEIPIPTREEIINSWKGPNIQFISGTRPDEHYDENIDTIMSFHKKYPKAFIHVGGYSDSQGSESSNMRISELRAKKVQRSLIKAGIPAEQLTYEAYGESNPVADNDSVEGRMKNRRAEVSASTVKRVIDTKGMKR